MKYERIKFLVLALKNAVEVYAWAPKPYHKFMAFKVRACPLEESNASNLKTKGYWDTGWLDCHETLHLEHLRDAPIQSDG